MQVKQFKNRTLNETAIFIALMVVLTVIAYLLNMVGDDYTQSNTQAKAQLEKIEEEFNSLQQKYTFVTQNAELYKEVAKKQEEGKFLIGRQIMFEKFNQFRSQFDLSNLRLSVSPVQEVKNPKFKRKYSAVNFSDVNIELDVLYDENVYELLNAMQRELSGVCIISHLSMSLAKPLDDGILKAISTSGTYPLIKTAIKFNWYSINPVESSDANDTANKK